MRLSPFVVCILAAGCGENGGMGPSPTPPDVAGTYTGSVVFTGGSPSAHCFAAGLARLRGHGFRYRVTLRQSGGSLSGTLDNTDMGIACGLSGSVDGSANVVFTQDGCSQPSASFSWSSEAQAPCELEVTQTGHRFEGRGGLNGTMTLDWTTRDRDTGVDLGPIQVNVSVALSKST